MNPRVANDVDAVLRARAAALAAPLPQTDAAGSEGMLLVFRLGRAHYALDPNIAGEVWPGGHVARVPGRTPGLLGIINVRGRLLPLFDLARVLKLQERDEREPGFVIVAVHDREELGFRVDAIDGTRRVASEAFIPTVGAGAGAWIGGALSDGTLVLNGPALFAAVTECTTGVKQQAGGPS